MTDKSILPQPQTAARAPRTNPAQKQPFWRDECGAISVDWVVLCAAMVGLVGATFTSLTPVVINRISSMLP